MIIDNYGTTDHEPTNLQLRPTHIKLKNYKGIFNRPDKLSLSGFFSTINFFEDLVDIT